MMSGLEVLYFSLYRSLITQFQVGVVNITDPALLHGFAVFMRARLGLPYPIPVPSEPAVCLVRRSGSRRILNEEEVVIALSKFVKVEVVQFDALSYREQVSPSPISSCTIISCIK